MREFGPLGRSDVLAHVDDAVHGYVRVGLHQTADMFQSVFPFQVLDVLSDGRSSTILLRQMLFKPLDYCLVIIPEVGLDSSLCFNKPASQHRLHVSVTEVLVGLQNLTLDHLLQQEAAQTPVEEGPNILPI